MSEIVAKKDKLKYLGLGSPLSFLFLNGLVGAGLIGFVITIRIPRHITTMTSAISFIEKSSAEKDFIWGERQTAKSHGANRKIGSEKGHGSHKPHHASHATPESHTTSHAHSGHNSHGSHSHPAQDTHHEQHDTHGSTDSHYADQSTHLRNQELAVPQILGPLNGTRFVSRMENEQKVTLRWAALPRDIEPQVEIHRLDDPEFKAHPELTQSGTTVILPDGSYAWRVRAILSEEERSNWSKYQTFSIHEGTDEAREIVITNSKKRHRRSE